MTPRLTYTNIAVLGLIQVGAVVFGVLGSGVTYKMAEEFGMSHTWATRVAVEWGFVALVLPLAWITVAMIVQGKLEASEDAPEVLTFLSGLAVLFTLMAGALCAAVAPWFRLCSFGLSA